MEDDSEIKEKMKTILAKAGELGDRIEKLSKEDREKLFSVVAGHVKKTIANYYKFYYFLAAGCFIIALFAFFGYKLYRSVTEKERKREEKKRQKEQKKKHK